MPKGIYVRKQNNGFQKGHKINVGNSWNKGKHLSEKHKKNLSEVHKGLNTWAKGKKVLNRKSPPPFTKEHIQHLKGKKAWSKRPKSSGKNHWRWKGGVSKKEYQLKEQERIAGRKKPEQCEICGAMGKICFDHNHETGEFRGWICHRCNIILGFSKDNSELLFAIIKYIKNNG